jgi:hypothetical protein
MECKKCLIDKDANEFYAKDLTCKEFRKEKVRENRAANIEKCRAYDRARGMLPHRVAARERYQQTEAGKAAISRVRHKYINKHPGRRTAHVALGNAVRDGRVIPWPVCAIPDCNCKPEAHHPDYGRPLDVVWLCRKHHKGAHALAKAA